MKMRGSALYEWVLETGAQPDRPDLVVDMVVRFDLPVGALWRSER